MVFVILKAVYSNIIFNRHRLPILNEFVGADPRVRPRSVAGDYHGQTHGSAPTENLTLFALSFIFHRKRRPASTRRFSFRIFNHELFAVYVFDIVNRRGF